MHLSFASAAAVPLGSEGDPGCIFLLFTHTKQRLLVTICDTLAGIEISFRTDRRGSQNSYLDMALK